MPDLITLIGSSLTVTKNLVELAHTLNNSALIKQLSDLTLQLAQSQNEAARMMTELRLLKTEQEEREKNPIRYDGLVYRDIEDHPYCPACYDDRRKRIHLTSFPMVDRKTGFECPICHAEFEKAL
ncbi:MAG: hypothetical protein LBF75_08230 [Treponema sp.]|nr:hypothetical protein [Treponema sp.]